MSILEKLRGVQSSLSNIRIPAAFTESVTIPIFNTILELDRICQELENSQSEKSNEEIKMEVSSSEGMDNECQT